MIIPIGIITAWILFMCISVYGALATSVLDGEKRGIIVFIFLICIGIGINITLDVDDYIRGYNDGYYEPSLDKYNTSVKYIEYVDTTNSNHDMECYAYSTGIINGYEKLELETNKTISKQINQFEKELCNNC